MTILFLLFLKFLNTCSLHFTALYMYIDTDTVISTLDRLLYMNGLHGGCEGACFVWRECDTKHISLHSSSGETNEVETFPFMAVKRFGSKRVWRHLSLRSTVGQGSGGVAAQFSSVQDGIYALGKAHMRSTPSLRNVPNFAFETVPNVSSD